MQKDTKTALLFCGVGIALILTFVVIKDRNVSTISVDEAVSIENGVQTITILAKGGFTPSMIEASAGVPTELRVVTSGTYDCSSTLIISALGYRQSLVPTGTVTIPIDAQQAAGTIEGICSMGMYRFQIAFK